jgi:glycosyltransferase involved in cell wall biosynthesis
MAAIVAPLRIANGVQNKVLEAMAMAKPVIATPRALAGVVIEREIVEAGEGESGFAEVASLARDDLAGLGTRARARILASYDWQANMAALDPWLDGVGREGGESRRRA